MIKIMQQSSLQIMPISCSLCNHSMINSFKFIGPNKQYLEKSCNQLNHKFYCISYINQYDKIFGISCTINSKKTTSAVWCFYPKRFYISEIELGSLNYFPWIEPDFSNPITLFNKIKILITFS